MAYVLAIDEGTTGTKALLVSVNGETPKPVAEHTIEFKQYFPQPGWVEHDLEEIWKAVLKTIQKVTAGIDTKEIVALGITNQRETVCFWEKATGKPLAHAIVWQDRRTAVQCQNLKARGTERFFQEKTGLLLDPYFSGTKVAWALENWPSVKSAHQSGKLAVGTIDSYLLARLTGGNVHVTEPSNASRTLCFNLEKHIWDPELCSALGIPNDIWPEVRPSKGNFGTTHSVPGLPNGIPISGILGDQQAALMGQACVDLGNAKCTYGTGAFLLLNTGKKPVKSRHQLLTTIAWALSDSDYTYALEGSAFIAGAAVQWARDGLKLIKKSEEIESLAKTVTSSEGVTFVPSLTGLGAPYWDTQATGMLTGITRGTERGHIARAILEGIAFQNADILKAMEKDLGQPLASLNVDGGACSNDLMMQFQADVLGVTLSRPVLKQTTSLGAVFAAGLGIGLWTDFQAIRKTWMKDRDFVPALNEKEREAVLKRWNLAVSKVRHSN